MKLHCFFSVAGLAAMLPLVWAVPASASSKQKTSIPAASVITVESKHSKTIPDIQPSDVEIEVNGQIVPTREVIPLRGPHAGLELVILIDSGARNSLGRQLNAIAAFIKSLPPTTEVAVAYMVNARAVFARPFTTDKAVAAGELHIPSGVAAGSASPYFCIRELAEHWPSNNVYNRREVIAITNGIDPYDSTYDRDDPYVRSAIHAAIRAGVTVDAIYWNDTGLPGRAGWISNNGLNLLTQVTGDTGGQFYYEGFGNPVSFQPFFREIANQLGNQYELSFMVPAGPKPQIVKLKIKVHIPDVRVAAQRQLFIPSVRAR